MATKKRTGKHITTKQRIARKKNIAIARKYKKSSGKIRSGDYVKGTAESLTSSVRIKGTYIAKTGNLSLIATKHGGRKKYIRVANIKRKKDKSPKSLLAFAKKHSMYGLE